MKMMSIELCEILLEDGAWRDVPQLPIRVV